MNTHQRTLRVLLVLFTWSISMNLCYAQRIDHRPLDKVDDRILRLKKDYDNIQTNITTSLLARGQAIDRETGVDLAEPGAFVDVFIEYKGNVGDLKRLGCKNLAKAGSVVGVEVPLARLEEIALFSNNAEKLWQQSYFDFPISSSSIIISNDLPFLLTERNLVNLRLDGNTVSSLKLFNKDSRFNPSLLSYKKRLLTASFNRVYTITTETSLALNNDLQVTRIRETVPGYLVSVYMDHQDVETPVVFILDPGLLLSEEKSFKSSFKVAATDATQIGDRIFCLGEYRLTQSNSIYHTFLEIF